ncbi:hypothetical protein [Janibacter alittae]|uniref:Uncharacterized protein n=1 Tax=Janibacter alittae TaxID=3115209 RepID=A0ABZ2MES9_9MICO
MGLTTWITRRAVRSAHVLIVEMPGHWTTRVHVERVVRAWGWHPAVAPADADLLIVCGAPGPQMAPLVERVWGQLPGPRAQATVTAPAEVIPALGRAQAALLDQRGQWEDARDRAIEPDVEHGDTGHGDVDHGEMDHGDMDHGDMDHGDMDHGDMDHGDMDMKPGGIPLAEGSEDRDGLEMDVLHVSLGPLLPHWPAGLVLDCSLQGDVVVAAKAAWILGDVVGAHESDAYRPGTAGAVRLDNVATVLALAGWVAAATSAWRLRDDVLGAQDPHALRPEIERLRRRVARNRLLRWSLRRVRPIDAAELAERTWPRMWEGDVHDRLMSALDRASASLATSERRRGALDGSAGMAGPAVDVTEVLPQVVHGLDVATARLAIASLDLDPLGMTQIQHV